MFGTHGDVYVICLSGPLLRSVNAKCYLLYMASETNLRWEGKTSDTSLLWEKQEQSSIVPRYSWQFRDDGIIRQELFRVFNLRYLEAILVFNLSTSILVPHMARSKYHSRARLGNGRKMRDPRPMGGVETQ